ncbi:hypothetical protein DMA15_35595 [Streptomyces sp. WAC 01529]|uniref:hypothetical protein n=1 Tax=Streptomyces sp. WAC 01529 TaxID=2203205 RepID=UPI000F6FA0DA|nr:hypothetical protein [Streptomyces sp. WAC 01529]AZM57226.1 hypothetical protein DMA15_35595 [Streptomyces sp. WAC 01529]
MSNQKRALAVLTLAAAALAMGGPAEAAATAVHDAPVKKNNTGKAVGDTLRDPGTTSKHLLEGTKTGLTTAKTTLELAQRGMLPTNGELGGR